MVITDNLNFLENSAVVLGAFDGVHTAHKALIEATVAFAKEHNIKSAVFAFDLIPNKLHNLTTKEQQADIFKSLGIDILFKCKFGDVKDLSPNEFLNTYLKNCKFICVGYNFKFGKDRAGTTKDIIDFCNENNIACKITEEIKSGNDTISSTLIRSLLMQCDFCKAEKLLGRKVSISGVVEAGDKLGRKLGFPTANIENSNVIIPDGVYMTETIIDGVRYKSVTNIGGKPTIRPDVNRIETHIIGFSDDVYGKAITVEFIKKIRDIIKFDTLDELKAQLKKDIAICK